MDRSWDALSKKHLTINTTKKLLANSTVKKEGDIALWKTTIFACKRPHFLKSPTKRISRNRAEKVQC